MKLSFFLPRVNENVWVEIRPIYSRFVTPENIVFFLLHQSVFFNCGNLKILEVGSSFLSIYFRRVFKRNSFGFAFFKGLLKNISQV